MTTKITIPLEPAVQEELEALAGRAGVSPRELARAFIDVGLIKLKRWAEERIQASIAFDTSLLKEEVAALARVGASTEPPARERQRRRMEQEYRAGLRQLKAITVASYEELAEVLALDSLGHLN